MPLPRNIRPTYNTTLPSTGQKIKYQPFSVKEEKILVLAAESQEVDEMSNAIENILRNCIVSPSDLDIGSLALFDIEYLFLKTRSKSAGERIEIIVSDPEDEDYKVNHSISIDKIGIKKSDGHEKMIKMDENVVVNMKYPDLSFFVEGVSINNLSDSIETVCKCIDSLIVDDEVFESENMTTPELVEWVESLTTEQFAKIIKFFETMPKLSHTIKLTNERTGNPFTITLEGLADFF